MNEIDKFEREILEDFVKVFKEAVKYYSKIYKNPKVGKDTLSDSDLVKDMKVEITDSKLVISVYKYYANIRDGRKIGEKGVPTSVLIDWIKRKNIRPKGVNINQLAFLIQRAIKRDGIVARPFLDSAYNESLGIFDKELDKSLENITDKILIKFTKKQ